MKLAFVFGTRPEIIKLAPLFWEAEVRGIPYILIHTNQHYSPELDAIFFEELRLPAPKYNLNVGPGSQNTQTARMIERLDPILTEEQPSVVLVQGDTNSVLAGALAASKLMVPIGHVEGGLRSYDRSMPEEINRIITDHISNYLFPPTKGAAAILNQEGIERKKVYVVGNTIVDTVFHTSAKLTENELIPFKLKPGEYALLTMHRPSNVDTAEDLKAVLKALDTAHTESKLPFFFPMHPRTKNNIEKFKIKLPPYIQTYEPVGYLPMLTLQKFAAFVCTDSGGLQEESCILGTPCLTLRENTERPETVEVGASRIVGRDVEKVREALSYFASKPTWKNPFGDGTAGKQILDILKRQISG